VDDVSKITPGLSLVTPPALMFSYRGERQVLSRLPEEAAYWMQCPKCGAAGSIDPDPVTGHAIDDEPGRGLTVRPSVACACGWHVRIERGEARDV
jgi:hypothetical protein